MFHFFPRPTRGSIAAAFVLVLLAASPLRAAPVISVVDSAGDVGLYNAIALTSGGQPVVSYYDASGSDLKLATCTANCRSASPTWQVVTVENTGPVDGSASIALTASNQPVVSYYAAINGASFNDLKLATCTANCATASPTWQIVTVDSLDVVGRGNSIALTASGQPVVAYSSSNTYLLKLATCTANCATASPTWQIVTVDNSGQVGSSPSLALNASGQPVISYRDITNTALKLATCTANCATASPTWQIVTVDNDGDVGLTSSLKLNASGQPVIGYFDEINDDLKLATCTANCASAAPTWQVVVVDSAGSVGFRPSLALTATGQPVVSYYDFTNFDLKLATCTANCASASPTWRIVTVDGPDNMGRFSSLALTASGLPIVSYYDFTNFDLKLATVYADYTVTASPNPASAGGLLTCAPTSGGNQAATATIGDGQTANCVATPNAGYTTQSISGCSGTATGLGVNNYTSGAITGSCTITATFLAPPPAIVPALNEWLLLLLALMVIGVAVAAPRLRWR